MSLEDKVKDKKSEGFIKKSLKLGYSLGLAGVTTALSMSMIGTTGVFIGGALAAGTALGHAIRKTKSSYTNLVDSLKTYANINAIITPVLKVWDWAIPLIPNETIYGKIGRGIFASTAFNAYFEGMYKGAQHLIDNYLNPKGIVKSVKNNFYNIWKRSAIGFSPAYTIAANGPTAIFGIPTFAHNALGLGLYAGLYPIKVKENYKSNAPAYGGSLPAPAHA